MNAKQCDRCKRLYASSVEDDIERIEENNGRTAEIKVEYANAYQTIITLDLCRDCERKFFEWLDKHEVV